MEALELRLEVYSFLEKYYGKVDLDAMLKALIQPPSFTCIRVNTLKVTRDQLVCMLTEHLAKGEV
jgi:16S rRNA C967 or C1407 C5-methylase (RsmB/RsmF family)